MKKEKGSPKTPFLFYFYVSLLILLSLISSVSSYLPGQLNLSVNWKDRVPVTELTRPYVG